MIYDPRLATIELCGYTKGMNNTPTAARLAELQDIIDAADESGIIQAHEMLRLMSRAHPERHTTATLRQALSWVGTTDAELLAIGCDYMVDEAGGL